MNITFRISGKRGKFIRLPHGVAEITPDGKVRLKLEVDLAESDVNAADAVYTEAWKARGFIEKHTNSHRAD